MVYGHFHAGFDARDSRQGDDVCRPCRFGGKPRLRSFSLSELGRGFVQPNCPANCVRVGHKLDRDPGTACPVEGGLKVLLWHVSGGRFLLYDSRC